jgi:hypothetical protein
MTTTIIRIGGSQWQKLRSDIYIRDKGICWVCNEFVEVRDYDLGHLIDRCNGGENEYDNLSVMHHSCNINKPRHTTLEDAMKWKLNPSYLLRPKIIFKEDLPQLQPNVIHKYSNRHPIIPTDDKKIIRQLILEYFENRKELLLREHSTELKAAMKELSNTFSVSIDCIYQYMYADGIYKKEHTKQLFGAIKAKDNVYLYIYEHLDELLKTYNSLDGGMMTKSKIMKMNRYQLSIMFYLAGIKDYLFPKDLKSIQPAVARLGLSLRD